MELPTNKPLNVAGFFSVARQSVSANSTTMTITLHGKRNSKFNPTPRFLLAVFCIVERTIYSPGTAKVLVVRYYRSSVMAEKTPLIRMFYFIEQPRLGLGERPGCVNDRFGSGEEIQNT